MCAQCVAQATPMIAVGLGLLRRRALVGWLRARLPGRQQGGPARTRAPLPRRWRRTDAAARPHAGTRSGRRRADVPLVGAGVIGVTVSWGAARDVADRITGGR